MGIFKRIKHLEDKVYILEEKIKSLNKENWSLKNPSKLGIKQQIGDYILIREIIIETNQHSVFSRYAFTYTRMYECFCKNTLKIIILSEEDLIKLLE